VFGSQGLVIGFLSIIEGFVVSFFTGSVGVGGTITGGVIIVGASS